MKLSLYSIYDRLLGVYLTPFPSRGDAEAQRQILNTMRDPGASNLPIVTNPGDYDLVFLGEFDDESGKISEAPHKSGRPAPFLLVNLRSLLPQAAAARTPEPTPVVGGAPRFPGLDDPGVD